jgi:hypothetical protein
MAPIPMLAACESVNKDCDPIEPAPARVDKIITGRLR